MTDKDWVKTYVTLGLLANPYTRQADVDGVLRMAERYADRLAVSVKMPPIDEGELQRARFWPVIDWEEGRKFREWQSKQ